MQPHRQIAPAVRRACALATALCIALAAAAPAGAMPYDNERPGSEAARSVVTPTVVRETIVRPTTGVSVLVLVLAGGGVIAAMLGSGYLGARMTRHTPR